MSRLVILAASVIERSCGKNRQTHKHRGKPYPCDYRRHKKTLTEKKLELSKQAGQN